MSVPNQSESPLVSNISLGSPATELVKQRVLLKSVLKAAYQETLTFLPFCCVLVEVVSVGMIELAKCLDQLVLSK